PGLSRRHLRLQLRGRQRSAKDGGALRRHHEQIATALTIDEATERPFEAGPARDRSGDANPLKVEQRTEPGEIDALVLCVERRARPLAGTAERRDAIVESRVAALEGRRRLRDGEAAREPLQRSAEVGERQVVDARDRARERARQIAAAFEQMKDPGEASLAAEAPALARKEDLAHARELHDRLHVPGLLWPARHVDHAGDIRSGTVGNQLQLAEPDERSLDTERTRHVSLHRHVLLDGDGAVSESCAAAVFSSWGQSPEIRKGDS